MSDGTGEPDLLAVAWRRSAWSTGVAGLVVIASLLASALTIQKTSASLAEKKQDLKLIEASVKQLRKQSQTLEHKRVELEHYNRKLEHSLGEKAKRHAHLREQNQMLLQSIQTLSEQEGSPEMEIVTESMNKVEKEIQADSPILRAKKATPKPKGVTETESKNTVLSPKHSPNSTGLVSKSKVGQLDRLDGLTATEQPNRQRPQASGDLSGEYLHASATRAFRAKNRKSKDTYRFSLWFEAPLDILRQIREISYSFNHPSFRGGRTMKSSEEQLGYRVGYRGWGCLSKVEVRVDYKDGRVSKFDVNQCAAILQNKESASGS